MVDIESPLGRTSGTRAGSQSGRVLTVEDQSEYSQEESSFGHNPVYRAGTVQRQGEARGYQRVDPRQKMSEDDLKEFEERRNEAVRAQKSISAEARARIEFLLNLGRMVKSVTVDETEFTFQSLPGEELNEVFNSLSQFENLSALKMQYEVRFNTLARALTHIQGKPFSAVIESDEIDDKLDILRGMDESLTDHLYKWYQKNIVETCEARYAIKNEADAEEVIDAIKKS